MHKTLIFSLVFLFRSKFSEKHRDAYYEVFAPFYCDISPYKVTGTAFWRVLRASLVDESSPTTDMMRAFALFFLMIFR